MLMRQLTGDVLRQRRLARGMTMREVSALARVSLGYISEVERGHKEPSSELLAALCGALGVPLSAVLRDVAGLLELDESTHAVPHSPEGLEPPSGTPAYAA